MHYDNQECQSYFDHERGCIRNEWVKQVSKRLETNSLSVYGSGINAFSQFAVV